MAKKADKIEYEQRVDIALGLMARGWRKVRIVHNLAKTWGVKNRQAYNYVRSAEKRIEARGQQKREHLLDELLARHDDLRDKGYGDRDHRLVLDVDKEDAKLLGLYPAEKRDVKVSMAEVDNAIERELALLAAAKEAALSDGTEEPERSGD